MDGRPDCSVFALASLHLTVLRRGEVEALVTTLAETGRRTVLGFPPGSAVADTEDELVVHYHPPGLPALFWSRV